jgi:hypothetical protein
MMFRVLSKPREDAWSRLFLQGSNVDHRRPGSRAFKDQTGSSRSRLETSHADEEGDKRLGDLNTSLAVLASIFPDIQIEVFREMLSTFDEESRLHVVTEALLKHKSKWVKGRWRISNTDYNRRLEELARTEKVSDLLHPGERFRTPQYKGAVQRTLRTEFRGLSSATIDAVLAEHNYSYTQARPTLVTLSSKSWRYAFSTFLFRRKPPAYGDPKDHPLLYHQGLSGPAVKATGSAELDNELYDTLIAPIHRQEQEDQESLDFSVAIQVNEAQAQEDGALYDCECCLVSTPMEQLSACSENGHFICFQCIRHSMNEALFGQGWSRMVDLEHSTLGCMAPTIVTCQGCVPKELVIRALEQKKGGTDIYRQFEDRLTGDALSKSRVNYIRCPFCAYAEVDDIYLSKQEKAWRFKHVPILPLGTFLFAVLVTTVFLMLLPFLQTFFSKAIEGLFSDSIIRLARRKRSPKFQCCSRSCGRVSCINCSKPWHDPHVCFESERLRYASHISNALSSALKRTCPRCSLSFVKSSGCNKLTCVCGYTMCYVCRKDLSGDEGGYRHFCEHFRPRGGNCGECQKCDLYRDEDEHTVLQQARKEAERTWAEGEGRTAASITMTSTEKPGWDWHDSLDMVIDSIVQIPS